VIPRVSVVIPVFNAGRDLLQALRSVSGQTFAEHELVLVDDGSTDPLTVKLLDDARTRPNVTLHRTENRGPAAARNLGIEHARAPYILPLDADDWLDASYLAKTVPILDAEPDVGVVHTWVGLVGGHHGTWKTGPFSLPELLSRCTLHVTSLYRRELWRQAGGYDGRFRESAEDWDLWLGAAGRGWTGRCVPEVLCYYRRSPQSRERLARAPGVWRRLVGDLVTKHRALYEAQLPDAMAGLYEEYASVCGALERVYDNPAVRTAVRLRGLLGRR
jgi:glycosyltransferase involved in cell wall biosynthesis